MGSVPIVVDDGSSAVGGAGSDWATSSAQASSAAYGAYSIARSRTCLSMELMHQSLYTHVESTDTFIDWENSHVNSEGV